ncbi:MAG: M14 family zinc carboxypeptidase [Myxococcota bacterium]
MFLPLLCLASSAFAGTVDLGSGLPSDAVTRGTWVAQEGARLQRPAAGYMDVLLPDPTPMRDGVAEAVIALGARPSISLVIRATTEGQPDADLEGLSMVGLTLRKGRATWERWDGGASLALTATPSSPANLASRTVRVRITAEGPSLTAEVFDQRSGAQLAVLKTWDQGSGSGLTGVKSTSDSQSRLLSLRTIPTADDDTTIRPTPNAPLGPRRLVLFEPSHITPEQRAKLGTSLGLWPYDSSGRHGALLDSQRATQLARDDARIQEQPLVPFWAVDPDVRAAAGRVPLHSNGLPDLSASYKTPEMVEAVLDAWAQTYPAFAQKVRIGTSHRGMPIWALRINADVRTESDRPAILITGATHGSELLSTEYALDAAERLLAGSTAPPTDPWRRRLDGLDVWVVPLVNPDGNAIVHRVTRFGGRKNGRDTTANAKVDPWEGVDLNRNFPLGFGKENKNTRNFRNSPYNHGPSALSEPESQAIATLAHRQHFVASLSFHTNGSLILVPYTLNGVQNPSPNTAWTVAQALAAASPVQPSGKRLRVRKSIYPVNGTDQDWLRYRFGTTALLVEGSHHNPTSRSLRLSSVRALRPLMPTLLDRVLGGPTLCFTIVNDRGQPEDAVVKVHQEAPAAGEVWRNRSKDGLFCQLVPKPGPYTVTITAAGLGTRTQTVRPGDRVVLSRPQE